MKNLLLAIFVLVLAQTSFAGCIDDFRAMVDKTKVTSKFQRSLFITSKQDFKKLRSAELKAVQNYISYLGFAFDGTNELKVTSSQYQSKKLKESLGYKISVTDGGDESIVDYYIKIDIGMEDVAYLILYRYWNNQGPEKTFLCEKF